MNKRDLKIFNKAIDKFFDSKELDKLITVLAKLHSSEIFDYIKNWDENKIVDFISYIPNIYSSKLFVRFEPEYIEILLSKLEDEVITNILDELYIDEIIDLFEDISKENQEKIISLLTDTTKEKVQELLKYHTNEVGFNINVDFISIRSDITIYQAKRNIEQQVNVSELEIVGNIFVVNEKGKFLGYIKADTLLSKPDKDKVFPYVQMIETLNLRDNIARANDIVNKYDVTSVPVINDSEKLVGVINIDDVIKRFEDIEESFLEASAIVPSEVKYLDTSIFELYKHRIPWLISLLIIGTLTQIIVTIFQVVWVNAGAISADTATVSAIVSLALATSLAVSSSITDTAGNSGSQVSATLIRSIAIGEIGDHEYKRAILKELKLSIFTAFTIALVSFFRLFVVWGIMGFLSSSSITSFASGHSQGWAWGWLIIIALLSSFIFFVVVVIGNFIGSILPIIALKSKKTDGAIISGPVQTTMVDFISFTLYLSLTTAIFIPLLNSGTFDPVAAPVTDSFLNVSSFNLSYLSIQHNIFMQGFIF